MEEEGLSGCLLLQIYLARAGGGNKEIGGHSTAWSKEKDGWFK
jgi:hypothetical protein